MKIEWNRATWYSKLLAVILGLLIIWLGIYFTKQYQEIKRMNNGTDNPVKNSLTIEDIENITFNFGENSSDEQTLTFKNGKCNFEFFMGKSDGEGEDVPNTRGFADINNIHITDIDGDGNQDAVAVLGINYEGSGYFEHLIFFINVEGEPLYKGYVFLGDRVEINSMNIDKGIIIIDMTHNPNRGCCLPDTPILKLKFEGGKLVEIKDDVSSVDTSNWKTYKNEKYGFEFKYPSKHQINTYSPNGVLSVSVTDDITDVATGDGACSSVSPEIYQKEKENIEKGIAKSETSFGISKIIQIGNGRKALYTIDTCQGVAEDDKPARMIVRMELFDDNKLISIGFSGLNSSKKIKVQDVYEVAKQLIDGTYNGSEQRLIDEFDQILSTFKFTK